MIIEACKVEPKRQWVDLEGALIHLNQFSSSHSSVSLLVNLKLFIFVRYTLHLTKEQKKKKHKKNSKHRNTILSWMLKSISFIWTERKQHRVSITQLFSEATGAAVNVFCISG